MMNSSIPLYRHTIVRLSIHQLKDIWLFLGFGNYKWSPLLTFLCSFHGNTQVSLIWGKYPSRGLNHMLSVCLALSETARGSWMTLLVGWLGVWFLIWLRSWSLSREIEPWDRLHAKRGVCWRFSLLLPITTPPFSKTNK